MVIFMLWLPCPVEGHLDAHWIEGCVGLMSGLDAVDKKFCTSSDPTLWPNPYIDQVTCAPSLNYHLF